MVPATHPLNLKELNGRKVTKFEVCSEEVAILGVLLHAVTVDCVIQKYLCFCCLSKR
jgi:hypothetical protein